MSIANLLNQNNYDLYCNKITPNQIILNGNLTRSVNIYTVSSFIPLLTNDVLVFQDNGTNVAITLPIGYSIGTQFVIYNNSSIHSVIVTPIDGTIDGLSDLDISPTANAATIVLINEITNSWIIISHP